MNRSALSKYWLPALLLGIAGVNFIASNLHYRLDLTQEKRYTLSAPTKKLLKAIREPVSITVFLDGEMPADFRNLRNATEELLQEFREYGGSDLQFTFQKPGSGLSEEEKQAYLVYLDSLGVRPTNVKVQSKAGESQEERLVYPSALVTHAGKTMPIDLLQGQDMSGGIQTLNAANALLEFKFANAIQKSVEETAPTVGYLVGNGEPLNYNVYDLIERTLKPAYGFGFVPIDSVPVIPLDFDALFIVKPATRFSDQQKLKLDQYVMHGGKIIWMIDNLYAEMDSLMRTQADFTAFDRDLNIEDQLFRYGVRINQDLLQDLQCDKIALAVGSMGDKPQMQLVPWPYFPLLNSYNDHPIAKNLNVVLSIFPNSIDTVEAEGIRKTILLASSANARTLGTPAIVSLNSARTEEEVKTFNRKNIPVAVLLEGRFTSLFANRISTGMKDSLAAVFRQPYLPVAMLENQMIVIADADIASNVVTQNEGPLAMGMNQFTKTQYANKDFITNCIEYLVNSSGILSTRAKTFTLRLLDPAKMEAGKTRWQIINVTVPVVLVLLLAIVYQAAIRRKFVHNNKA